MLEQVLLELNNWFRVRDEADGLYPGAYTIADGRLAAPFLEAGQYFRLLGSRFNDGLHQAAPEGSGEEGGPAGDKAPGAFGAEGSGPRGSRAEPPLRDESFEGVVWALAVPPEVVRLAREIEAWQERHGPAALGPYASESFGGYSYTRATDAATGGPLTWQGAFRARLAPYRRLRAL